MLVFAYKDISSRLGKMQNFFAKAAGSTNFIVSNYSVNSSKFYVVIHGEQHGLSERHNALPSHFSK